MDRPHNLRVDVDQIGWARPDRRTEFTRDVRLWDVRARVQREPIFLWARIDCTAKRRSAPQCEQFYTDAGEKNDIGYLREG